MKRISTALLVLAAACSEPAPGAAPGSDGGPPIDVPDGGEPIDPDGGTLPDGAPAGKTLTFMTLNMHGFHAMNEKPRFFEDRSGVVTEAASSPFYFTRAELDRGNGARLDALAADLEARLPDVIALQEVAAGSPDVARDCTTFDNAPLTDSPSANTARRLASRLSTKGYSVEVACRGNVGWNTDPNTFKDRRIVTLNGNAKSVVHEFDSNPYPGGILVEGFGLLYRAPLKAVDATTIDVVINANDERTKAQLVTLDFEGRNIVVVNVHGGHKVQHFEQAVAVRKAVSDHLAKTPGPHRVVFLGDFNSRLHRPKNPVFLDEPSIVPWEIEVKGEYSYRDADEAASFTALRDALRALNASSYKSFASLPEGEANARIDAAIGKMKTWLASKPEPLVFTEALSVAEANGACKPPKTGFGACETDARIDHVFFGGGLSLVESHALYTNADDHTLAGTLSDHPAVVSTLRLDP